MKNYILLLVVILGFISCNQETIRLKGKIEGIENTTAELRMKTKSGKEKIILAGVELKGGHLKAHLDETKPPLKLTLAFKDGKKVDFWIFKYGKLSFSLDINNLEDLRVNDSFEHDELERVNNIYNNMYLKPLKEQMDWVANYESVDQELTNESDEAKLEYYKTQIKKAYRLRKKSILKTIRKSPQNPISMALFFDEFETLTSWQRKECLKIAQRYYSDTEMNWQLKN